VPSSRVSVEPAMPEPPSDQSVRVPIVKEPSTS
jgi:hypothetical protein